MFERRAKEIVTTEKVVCEQDEPRTTTTRKCEEWPKFQVRPFLSFHSENFRVPPNSVPLSISC